MNPASIHWMFIPKAKFHSISLYDIRFWDTSLLKIGNAPLKRPQNDLKHLTVNSRRYTLNYTPRPKFHPVLLYDNPCSRYQAAENRKCTEWPQNDLKDLTVKRTLYTHPWLSNFTPFRSTTSRFRDTRCWKSKFTEWPQNDLKNLTVKRTLHWIFTSRGPNFTPLHSTTSRVRDTRFSKLEMRRTTQECP